MSGMLRAFAEFPHSLIVPKIVSACESLVKLLQIIKILFITVSGL